MLMPRLTHFLVLLVYCQVRYKMIKANYIVFFITELVLSHFNQKVYNINQLTKTMKTGYPVSLSIIWTLFMHMDVSRCIYSQGLSDDICAFIKSYTPSGDQPMREQCSKSLLSWLWVARVRRLCLQEYA